MRSHDPRLEHEAKTCGLNGSCEEKSADAIRMATAFSKLNQLRKEREEKT